MRRTGSEEDMTLAVTPGLLEGFGRVADVVDTGSVAAVLRVVRHQEDAVAVICQGLLHVVM